MWYSERKDIEKIVLKYLKMKKMELTIFNTIIVLDHLGYLRDRPERDKWEALKHGGSPYLVGPVKKQKQ